MPGADMQVSKHGLGLITGFEGKPRTEARLCEGGAYELGWGSTYFPDGRPVTAADMADHAMAEAMLAHCMKTEMAPVIKAFKKTPTQFWFDAFASFAYNVGGYNVVGEPAQALVLYNEGRYADAAAAFVGWISATSAGPTSKEVNDPYYEGVWADTPKGPRWIGPDGTPCEYKRKMRGLLRRRLAEGCVALGYDWRAACAKDVVFLRRERIWRASRNRWEDRVVSMTQLKDVLPVAKQHPLPFELVETIPEPVRIPTPAPIEEAPMPDVIPTPAPAPRPVPTPSPVPYGAVSLENDPKDMLASKRFWGMLILVVSRFSFLGVAGQTALGEVIGDPILFDAAAAGLAMAAIFGADAFGQWLHWYGKKKATATLK